MKALLKTFASGHGDCIFLCLTNGEGKYSIMVDCGEFTSEIESFVTQSLSKHIDLLIITHIDCDHVDGVTKMLKKIPYLTIGKIFYNCYQNVVGEGNMEVSDVIQKNIQTLQSILPSRAIKTDTGKINMEAASVLAAEILKNDSWNNVWEKEYIHEGTNDFHLKNNFGRIVFLAPTIDTIKSLDDDFKREYMRLFKERVPDGLFVGKETLFELITKFVAMKTNKQDSKKIQKIKALIGKYNDNNWIEAQKYVPKIISPENSASIAFFWEYNEHRILFMGDAEPNIVVNNIKSRFSVNTPVIFDAIKVAHHGSKHSTSNELMSVIDSKHYFITGGNKIDKPSLEALAKIVMRNTTDIRIIHYNNKNNCLMIDLEKDEMSAYKSKYKFQITDKNEQEFEY